MLADLCSTEVNKSLVEHKDLTVKSQPGWFVAQLLRFTENIPEGRLWELMQLVKRPTLPKVLFQKIDETFKVEKGELEQHCYDPMAPSQVPTRKS